MVTASHWKLARAGILALLVAASAPRAATGVGGPLAPWRAVAASGRVEARSAAAAAAGDWHPVTRGDELAPATLLRTGPGGRITLARNASVIVVDPDSEIELPASARPGMETSVTQNSGSAVYEVDSRKSPHFEVVTPYLVAGVKGTRFLVSVGDGYASVAVERGLVAVSNPDTGAVLDAGPGTFVLRERGKDEMELIDGKQREAHPLARKEAERLARVEGRGESGGEGAAASGADRLDPAVLVSAGWEVADDLAGSLETSLDGGRDHRDDSSLPDSGVDPVVCVSTSACTCNHTGVCVSNGGGPGSIAKKGGGGVSLTGGPATGMGGQPASGPTSADGSSPLQLLLDEQAGERPSEGARETMRLDRETLERRSHLRGPRG